MLAEAKTIYQRALKIKDIPNSKRSDAKLRIAIIYKESKKWDFAKTFLLDILETSADNAASISSSQLVLTQYTLAKVHLGVHKLDQGENYCREAINTTRKAFGQEFPDYIRAVHLLIVICEFQR
jgi:hypothetical protein